MQAMFAGMTLFESISNHQSCRLVYCFGHLRSGGWCQQDDTDKRKYHIPGYLRNHSNPAEWDEWLSRTVTWGTVKDLSRMTSCLFCPNPISKNSIGDHLIPTSKGGKQSPDNRIPLCRSCNSSKGQKDFIEWCGFKGYHLNRVDPDALMMYARLKYEEYKTHDSLEQAAPVCVVNPIHSALLFYSPRERQSILQATGVL